MKRYEACALLTNIASSDMIDLFVSKEIFKARDICVCSPNKILDVLATDESRKMLQNQMHYYLTKLLETDMLSIPFARKIRDCDCALNYGFEEGCDEAFLKNRCQRCPNYKGNGKC